MPGKGAGNEFTESWMGEVVLTADFRCPQPLFLMISSQMEPVTTQDLHSTSLAKRLDAGCFRFLFLSLSVYL